jgi:hypothetical protein
MLVRRPALSSANPSLIFRHFHITPRKPSICIAILFNQIQTSFPAAPLFSHRSKTPGCHAAYVILRSDQRISLFPQPASFQQLAHSLSRKTRGRSFFSTTCGLFCEIPGGGVCTQNRPNGISNLQTLFFPLSQVQVWDPLTRRGGGCAGGRRRSGGRVCRGVWGCARASAFATAHARCPGK